MGFLCLAIEPASFFRRSVCVAAFGRHNTVPHTVLFKRKNKVRGSCQFSICIPGGETLETDVWHEFVCAVA